MANVTKRNSSWQMTPVDWSPQRLSHVSQNYTRAFQNTSPEMRSAGARFYPLWNETAEHIGDVVGGTTAHGAAILAHLSPSNEAEKNRIQGLQLAHTLTDKVAAHIIMGAEHASLAKSHEVRARNKNISQSERDFHLSEYSKHASEVRRHRKATGFAGTPLGTLALRELANAVGVIQNRWENPLESLETDKIRDFGHLIHDPSATRVPIDTHYHDAGLDLIDLPYKAKRGLDALGRYDSFQRASAMGQRRYEQQSGETILPGAFMGGIWYGHQQRKVRANPDAMSARRAADTIISGFRSNPKNAHFLPEAFGLEPSFGKIDIGR